MHLALSRKIIIELFLAVVMSLSVSMESATAAADATPDKATYAFLEKFHGHVCAGSLFGARLGQAAKAALRSAGGEGKFKAVYYDLSCPVDGIQVTAGTTHGNAALSVEDRDEHRLVLTAEGNKRKVEARLTKKAEDMGPRYKELKKKARALPDGSPERARLERECGEILDWLREAETGEVVIVGAGGGAVNSGGS